MTKRAPNQASGGWRPRHPLVELTAARIREFIREPGALFWVFVFPLLLAIGLGLAFRERPPDKAVVAVERGAPDAVRLVRALRASGRLEVQLLEPKEARQALARGKVALVVGAAAGAGPAATDKGAGAPRLSYRYDPQRPESGVVRLSVDDALQRGLGRLDVLHAIDVTARERGARYIDFLIPGLIGLNLMGSSLWGIGFVIVQNRNRKLLKRFAATPLHRSHYLLAFGLSRLIFLIAEVSLLLLFAYFVFDVHIHGSLLTLTLIALLGSASFGGLALLIASRAETVEVASGWMNLVMLPMWLLSGAFFSYERFPEWMHAPIRALPLTAVNDALRAVINQGQGLVACWPQLAILTAWGVVAFTVALKIFRWR
jgi:ABC-2 type transport system permease protein